LNIGLTPSQTEDLALLLALDRAEFSYSNTLISRGVIFTEYDPKH